MKSASSKMNKNIAKVRTKLSEIIEDRPALTLIEKIIITLSVTSLTWHMLVSGKYTQKVHRLSVQSEESFTDAFLRVVRSGFRLLPSRSDRLDFSKGQFVVVSVEPTVPIEFKIKTNDGFIFNDWEGSKKQYSLYWLFKDLVPAHVTPSTHFAASAVIRSFKHGDCRVPGDEYLPKKGGVIVEAGAYVGYKAIAFGRRVGPTGKVLAIELDKENFRLLSKNICQNNMSEWVKAVNAAVWDSETELTQYGANRMNNSIAKVDEKSPPEKTTVRTTTLSNLFNDNYFQKIDYLNLQLNGAELHALNGLGDFWKKIKFINIITRFKKDEVALVDLARKLIEENGGRIIVNERFGHLYNLTAKLD